MLQFFPFVGWLAAATSVVMLVMLWADGELRPRGLAIAATWLLIAGYCQFCTASPTISAAGLALLTLLAIGLIVRWRFTTP